MSKKNLDKRWRNTIRAASTFSVAAFIAVRHCGFGLLSSLIFATYVFLGVAFAIAAIVPAD